MAENVSGEIKVKLITETGTGAGEDVIAGKAAGAKVDPAKKEDSHKLSGMEKWLSIVGKGMKKVAPVFDVSNIIVSIIKKSQGLMAFIEAFFDIVGAFIDILLAPLFPIIAPILRILASLLPVFQVFLTMTTPILLIVAKVLDTVAKWVQEGAVLLKDFISHPIKIVTDIIDPLSDQVNSTMNSILDPLSSLFGGGKAKAQSGLSYVPHTMTAELHRGESVLTARETQLGNQGNSGITVQNPQFTINAGGSTTMDAKAFAQQLYLEFTKKLTEETRRS